MNNLPLKGLLYGLLIPLLAMGTCIGAAGCKSKLGGKDRLGFGARSTNEVYLFHDAERSAEQTGYATAELDLEPLLDLFIQWKASQADTVSNVDSVPPTK